ncbi:hypothetical protein ACRQU7_05455 [Caproiciproducens sp. R1]|uniref:hypothetical protein n=1 Tax=Caproiciproducens sp. R1 TaxID=3435000 RepID=UPI004034935C
MNGQEKTKGFSVLFNVIVWGTTWGIFEATVGYLLHMLPVNISWLLWYPVACFFMGNVYRKTGSVSAILMVGALCASIKMLNLFLPGRIDKVLNPAVSIVFEAMAMAAVLFTVNKLSEEKHRNPFVKALAALTMNTGWRLLYIFYLLFLVPDWIREVSVISSMDKFISFFVAQNLITSLILFIGYQFKHDIFRPIEAVERKMGKTGSKIPTHSVPALKAATEAILICINIALQFSL